MSLTDDLLVILTDYSGGYRLMRSRISGYPSRDGDGPSLQKASDNTIRVTLSRLKKKGLIENNGRLWRITKRGLDYVSSKIHISAPRNSSTLNRRVPKNMIVAFDIPEIYKKKRIGCGRS
ncbi:MAG: hypothetical protein AAB686_00415 [Patescibacteria group bacterium]